MTNRRIVVADDSASMRETLSVLLGGQYEVFAIPVAELLGGGGPQADLVVAPSHLRDSNLLPAGNYLWLGDGDSADEEVLPRRFRPAALRRWVSDALTPQESSAVTPPLDWRLSAPFLETDALKVVARALRGKLSLHIRGESGSGRESLARAIYDQRGGALIVCDATATQLPGAADLRALKTTVLALDVDRWTAAAQRHLAAVLATPASRDVKVVSTASADLAELLDSDALRGDFYYPLTHLVLHLRPLRERGAEIVEIAQALTRQICRRMMRSEPSFTDAATQRLCNYLWFGNLAELESVLTRTLALCDEQQIDAGDLCFDGTVAPPARVADTRPAQIAASSPVQPPPLATSGLSSLIHELAHELKNPLVTIKTFAQYCERKLVEDDADAASFAQLTNRAVDDLDRVLENLLAFARMRNPNRQPVRLVEILAPLAAQHQRGLSIEQTAPPESLVSVDPDQVAYAIDNLLHAVGRIAAPDQPIAARFTPPGSLSFELPSGSRSIGEELAELNDEEGDGGSVSLGLAIAGTVLERNGVVMTASMKEDPKSVTIRFPVEDEEAVARNDGDTTSIDR